METYCVDFETYYDNEVNVERYGAYNYVRHPETDIYLVSVFGPDLAYAGDPKKFNWELLNGHNIIAHNYSFDGECLDCLGICPRNYNCSANLSRYFGNAGNLRDAAAEYLGKNISKAIRHSMKGTRFCELLEFEKDAVREYALNDAKTAYEIWENLSPGWPENEQALSGHTIRMCAGGIQVEVDALLVQKAQCSRLMDQALSDIPWAVYDVALSPQRAKERCIMAGIPAPDSFSEDSEDCVAWENKYGEQYPFVSAMRKFRKANTLLEKINAIERRVMPSGRLRYDLKYFGAHTGRWSGSGGVNLQNLPREAFEGIDLRSLFIPAPGKKFIIADLSQIEPRMLAYLAGDLQTLDALKQGYSIYEAHAKTSNLWASEKGTLKKTNPGLYAMCKSRVLGLGYGLGSHRFRGVAKAMAGVDLSEFQAKQAVNNFRCTNPLIPRLWQRLDGALNAGLGIGRFTMTMPSGRQMRYEGLHRRGDGQIYFRQPNGMEVTTWGGKLTENLVSGTARDVFAEGILRLDTAGINVVLHIHDEVVCEVDRDVKKQDVLELLSITPQWLEGCPVAAEAIESDRYLK